MITTDELKVQLADYGTAVKDLEEALAIDASRKRVQELEHTMSRPGFYDDAELSKKVFDEVGDQCRSATDSVNIRRKPDTNRTIQKNAVSWLG